MSFPYRGVLFDWAWTLVDLGPEDDRAAFHALAGFLAGRGFVFENEDAAYEALWTLFREQIRVSRACGLEAHFESVLNYLAQERNWDWTEEFRREALTVYYREQYRQRTVYPEVKPTLEKLQQAGVQMGVVSNTTNPGFMKRYEARHLGLDSYFQCAVYSSEVPFRKPHPSIFRLACRRLGLSPRQVLFVGDHYEADIRGAGAVGLATAWLNRRGLSCPGEPGPDFEITRLDELLSLRPTPVAEE